MTCVVIVGTADYFDIRMNAVKATLCSYPSETAASVQLPYRLSVGGG